MCCVRFSRARQSLFLPSSTKVIQSSERTTWQPPQLDGINATQYGRQNHTDCRNWSLCTTRIHRWDYRGAQRERRNGVFYLLIGVWFWSANVNMSYIYAVTHAWAGPCVKAASLTFPRSHADTADQSPLVDGEWLVPGRRWLAGGQLRSWRAGADASITAGERKADK